MGLGYTIGHLGSLLNHCSSIIPLQIWDTPSNFDLDHLDVPLGSFSTIIYVMDMQASIPDIHSAWSVRLMMHGSKTTRITKPCSNSFM